MNTFPLAVIGLCVAPFFVASARQERQKPKQSADVPALLQQAGKAWEVKQFGGCSKALNQALERVARERAKAVRAEFPNAPEGFEKVVVKESEDEVAQAFTTSMALAGMIEQTYRESNGEASVDVSVGFDSPMVEMFSLWSMHPAALEAGSKFVKYDPHSAVLRKEGSGWQLLLLIGQDLCTATVQGRNEEFLLKMFDQAAVDRLAAALAN